MTHHFVHNSVGRLYLVWLCKHDAHEDISLLDIRHQFEKKCLQLTQRTNIVATPTAVWKWSKIQMHSNMNNSVVNPIERFPAVIKGVGIRATCLSLAVSFDKRSSLRQERESWTRPRWIKETNQRFTMPGSEMGVHQQD